MRRESQLMLPNQRRVWWPYLLFLAGLFVLSLSVPRAWQRSTMPQRSEERWTRTQKPAGQRIASAPIAVVRPVPVAASAPAPVAPPAVTLRAVTPPIVASPAVAPLPVAAIPPQPIVKSALRAGKAVSLWDALMGVYSVEGPMVEAVSQKIASFRSFNVPNPAATTSIVPHDAGTNQTEAKSSSWPKPNSVLAQLDHVAQHPEYHSWANQARELCIEVCENANDNTQWANQCLDKLDALCARADSIAATADDPHAAAELRRAKFAVERRVLVWGPALLIPQKTLTPEVFVDVNTVLAGVERYENSGLPRDAARIVEFEGGLNVSTDKNAQQLAQTLEQIYRNANVRLAISNDLLERLSSQGIDSAVRQQVYVLLRKLNLDPTTMSSDTTTERHTVRLRVGGANQLGGHTARPQAPSDSLGSVQVHESAINNALDQLRVAGRTFTLSELFQHLAKVTNMPDVAVPIEYPQGISITFAKRDPVQVRCENGMVRLTLAIDELRNGQHHWNNFTVVAAYIPEITRLHVRLARHGAIEVGGNAYHNQPEPALRGICNQILAPDRKLELVPTTLADGARLAGLSVTQCVLEDGWIGLALGPFRGGEQVAQRVGAEY